MANINAQEMQEIPLLIPPIELQDKYARIVQATRSRVEKFQTFLEDTDKLRAALEDRFFGINESTLEAVAC